MFKNVFVMVFSLLVLSVSPVVADDTGVDHTHDHDKEVKKPQDPVKLDLATKLNAAWGVKDQANAMINLIAREVPEAQRESFRRYMTTVIDLDEVDRISISAAVDVFTVEELEAMLEYYSKDVVKAAEKKRARYNQLIAPQIKTMIDKGMIEAAGELERLKSLQ